MNLNFERISLYGMYALLVGAIPGIYLCSEPPIDAIPPAVMRNISKNESTFTDFSIPLTAFSTVLSEKSESNQIAFSTDLPRPTHQIQAHEDGASALIRLSQSRQSKRVSLPTRVQLEFNQNGALQFSNHSDKFWLECKYLSNGQIGSALYLNTPDGQTLCKGTWTCELQPTPMMTLEEIPMASPFRSLAESKWWGLDLFAQEFGKGPETQKLEIGSGNSTYILELGQDQWIVFRDNKWQTVDQIDSKEPIARITVQNGSVIEMEGWENASHLRFKISPALSAPLKTKGDELFSQLRIRSEKQVSCVIDKQCLILRVGDWVLKANNRWKILRKQEEREAFLAGNMVGELFVLDRIDSKGATKSITGQLYSAKRSHAICIEFSQNTKSTKGPGKNR